MLKKSLFQCQWRCCGLNLVLVQNFSNWFNFYFLLLCIHYHNVEQWQIKLKPVQKNFKPRTNLNHNRYINIVIGFNLLLMHPTLICSVDIAFYLKTANNFPAGAGQIVRSNQFLLEHIPFLARQTSIVIIILNSNFFPYQHKRTDK